MKPREKTRITDERSGNSVAIFGCRYLEIRNCTIGRYAWLGIRLNAYENNSSHYIIIVNNIIDSGFHFYYGPPEKRGVEDGVLLSGGLGLFPILGTRHAGLSGGQTGLSTGTEHDR